MVGIVEFLELGAFIAGLCIGLGTGYWIFAAIEDWRLKRQIEEDLMNPEEWELL